MQYQPGGNELAWVDAASTTSECPFPDYPAHAVQSERDTGEAVVLLTTELDVALEQHPHADPTQLDRTAAAIGQALFELAR